MYIFREPNKLISDNKWVRKDKFTAAHDVIMNANEHLDSKVKQMFQKSILRVFNA